MSTQQLVGAAGIGLVAANAWTTQRPDLAPIFTGSGDLAAAHKAAKEIGVELVTVLVLVLISGTSSGASTAVLAVLACLWLLWAMTHYSAGGTPARQGSAGLRTGRPIPF